MGTNTLVTKNDGDVVSAESVNQHKTSQTVNLVPRNSSGVPTDNGGAVGDSSYGFSKLWLSNGSNRKEVSQDGNVIIAKDSSGNRIPFQNSSAVTTDGTDPGVGGVSQDASVAVFDDTSDTEQTVGETILTTSGRPVLVGLRPIGGSTTSAFRLNTDASDTLLQTDFKYYRDATLLGKDLIAHAAPTASLFWSIYWPLATIQFLDVPSAGTYTYKITATTSANTRCLIHQYQMFAIEL